MIDGRRVVALLLLGGSGSRLWPISTAACPKPFLKILGERSLYQMALARLRAAAADEFVVVVNAGLEQLVRDQAAEIGEPAPQLVLEPMPRDSGPALAAGVAALLRRHPADTIVIAAPGDHLIPDETAFADAVSEAARVAGQNLLVTFGIRPTMAAVEYGYIQRGAEIEDQGRAFHVLKFHEKPRQDIAEAYLRHGGYDWNSGIFVFAAGAFAREAERHMPDIWVSALQAVASGRHRTTAIELDQKAFAQARKTSIDYALLEKSDRVAMIPVSFAWSDIGSWDSVYQALEQDAAQNAVSGDAALRDASGTLVLAEQVRVVVVGLQDVVVVASPRGTFVAPRSRASEIKGLVGNAPG
jgi:mannose-1-phosphate guanylyltransferase / mannose-6-phosphate isomerase